MLAILLFEASFSLLLLISWPTQGDLPVYSSAMTDWPCCIAVASWSLRTHKEVAPTFRQKEGTNRKSIARCLPHAHIIIFLPHCKKRFLVPLFTSFPLDAILHGAAKSLLVYLLRTSPRPGISLNMVGHFTCNSKYLRFTAIHSETKWSQLNPRRMVDSTEFVDASHGHPVVKWDSMRRGVQIYAATSRPPNLIRSCLMENNSNRTRKNWLHLNYGASSSKTFSPIPFPFFILLSSAHKIV